MISFFKKKVKCDFCSAEVNKEQIFTLEYKASDCIGVMRLCLDCANDMNEIADILGSINAEKI